MAANRSSWSNWSGRQRARPAAMRFLRSEEDAAATIRQAAAAGLNVRAAGAGHSHAALLPTDGVIVDTSGLSGVIATDPGSRRARVWAGTRIHALGRPLHDAGLGLINQGDIDRQSIGGACATGTHGTGAGLGNLSTAVTGARLLLADGSAIDCDAGHDPELWQAVRLNLGALGLVTQLHLQVRDCYLLEEQTWTEPFDELLPRLDSLCGASRHFEFFWYPDSDQAVAKRMDEAAGPARYPLDEEGRRLAWSYEVLPNHRPHLHTEMEYSVPAEAGPACLTDIRELIRSDFPELRWPVEYRTLAADDVWLSTANSRPTVTISVHQDIRQDETDYFRACEAVFLSYAGRPHWGKVHYLNGTQLGERHPDWARWWSVRDRVDPAGVFLNDYLSALRP